MSRTQLKIAWTHHIEGESRQTAISVGDIVYENGVPQLQNSRLVLTSKDFPEGQRPKMIETQYFVGPVDQAITVTAYLIQSGHNTEGYLFDLKSKKLINFTNTPDDYEEVEGIFPDGKSTLVERNRSVGKLWPMVDAWRVWLDDSKEPQRLTRFLDFKGYKAANYTVSDDGRLMVFQLGISGDAGRVAERGWLYGPSKYKQGQHGPIASRYSFATRLAKSKSIANRIWVVGPANGNFKILRRIRPNAAIWPRLSRYGCAI